MTDTYEAAQDIVASRWSTDQLAAMALNWFTTSPAILTGMENPQPIWKSVGVDEDAAHEYYQELRNESIDQLRDEAAEALALSGWTISAINYKRS